MSELTGTAEGEIDRIVERRFFASGKPGRMLEIGAARPDWLSIGSHFRAKGWDVLSVEPNPVFADMHRALGHDVAEVACGAENRDGVDFTVVDCHGTAYRDGAVSFESFSSLGIRGDFAKLDQTGTHRQIKVDVRTADTILSASRPQWRRVDLLAIDIEGWEIEALSGLCFARHKPRVVILENLFVSSAYHRFMRSRGYVLWRMSFPNEVWVRRSSVSFVEALWCPIAAAVTAPLLRARMAAGMIKRALREALDHDVRDREEVVGVGHVIGGAGG